MYTEDKIHSLYNTIYEMAFAGDISKPPLVIQHKPDHVRGMFTCWFIGEQGHHQIEVFPLMQEDEIDLVDTLVHEMVHAMQFAKGRKLKHDKWFNKKLHKKLRKVIKAFKNA